MSIKLTKKRTAILNCLKAEKELLSAAEVSAKLPDIDLATIYRNLDLFSREGLIKKIQVGDEAKYEYQEHPHHHAICDDCGKTIHFDLSAEKLAALLPLKNFDARSVDVRVSGNCTDGH